MNGWINWQRQHWEYSVKNTIGRDKKMEFNKYFDHTILKADATEEDVNTICREAIQYGFASVCVNGARTKQVS